MIFINNRSTLFYSKMVFRIRDKSLFWTKSGWRNNWEPKILNMPRATPSLQTAYVTTRKDHHSYLRMVQSYRNYSRICRQYLYGDKFMQSALQMELRTAFRLPFNVQTPVELIKHGGERRMADQLDRDYELMTYNYHPFQLYAYKLHNQKIRTQNQAAERAEKKEQTRDDALAKAFEQELATESQNLPRGQKISLQKMGEIYNRVVNAMREHTGETDQTRGSDGEYNDYLEKRRPFVEADNLKHSH